MHLILIETSGNQNYIFATNKLRENVGASQLTYLVGTRYVVQAVHRANGGANGNPPQNFAELRDFLQSKENANAPVEIIVATSGKAILLVKSDDPEQSAAKAKEIVGFVTEKTLREAPGLSVYGVIEEFNPKQDGQDDLADLDKAIKRLHDEYEVVRSQLPGADHRFLRFPFAQACTTSNFPAQCAEYFKADNKVVFRSVVAQTKQDNSKSGRERMQDVTKYALECIEQKGRARTIKLPENLEKFEEAFPKTDWLAIIHADGNGLGQIFLDFGWASDSTGTDWRDYLKKLREFSLALDVCTINAYGRAVSNLYEYIRKETKRRREAGEKVDQDEENRVPLLPLVLGGDDLTLICDGRYAIQFAKDFLSEFEKETTKDVLAQLEKDSSENALVNRIAKKALGDGRLSSCAGVAIVKPHFPFHAAYGLAEELLQSAKKVKSKLQHTIKDRKGKDKEVPYPASALDYHILYDTSGVDLERIRGHLRVDAGEQTHLYARPYLVTPRENLDRFKDDAWLKYHHWENLKLRVDAMKRRDRQNPNRRLLPNSMLHELREGLFMGEQVANSRMKLARPRYQNSREQKAAFNTLLYKSDSDADADSLFCSETIKEGDTKKKICVTGFLDALDIVEFWRDEDDGQSGE